MSVSGPFATAIAGPVAGPLTDPGAGGGGGTDPYWANVSALLHCNGSDGSTTFTDSGPYGHTFTASGSANISTARSVYGGASGLFSSAGRIVGASHSSFGFDTGDLCIEGWVYFDSPHSIPRIMGNLTAGWGPNKWTIANISNGIQMYAYNYSAGSPMLTSTFSGLTGWHHMAITRDGVTWRLFLDGVVDATSVGWAGSLDGGGAQVLCIGSSGTPSTEGYNGSFDDVRITKGVPRYTSAFTPPAAQLPDS